MALDSSLFFVLDGTISSRAQEGSVIRAHLRDPIMLGGLTIAPAGSLVGIHLTHTQGAQIGNVDGYVDIYFDSLALASGQVLPLVTPTSHIDPHVTAGQNSTQTIADVTGDIFVPGYFLFSVLRKGLNVNLGPGTVIRARTAAALHLANGTVAIETPPPFPAPADTPYANFVPAPLVTPPGFSKPTPKPSPSPTPTATPTAQPT